MCAAEESTWKAELQRLVKLGWHDLVRRPERQTNRGKGHKGYPLFVAAIKAQDPSEGVPGAPSWRRAVLRHLNGLITRTDDPNIAKAWRTLLGMAPYPTNYPASVKDRRMEALAEYRTTRKGKSEATFRRIEEEELFPPLISILEAADAPSPTTVRSKGPDPLEVAGHLVASARDKILLYRFAEAEDLLRRARDTCPLAGRYNEAGLRLHMEIYTAWGHIHRDRGETAEAEADYKHAGEWAKEAHLRVEQAQAHLHATVVREMRAGWGESPQSRTLLSQVYQAYVKHSTNPLLGELERQRAAMWAGSALHKLGKSDEAVKRISKAKKWLISEGYDITSSHVKLATAQLSAYGPDVATKTLAELDSIDASSARRLLQQVRRGVAYSRILLSQPRTRDDGLTELQRLFRLAMDEGYGHQAGLIEGLMTSHGAAPRQ